MKTTLELPDDLLVEAKTLAVRRKTTVKALVESALRRKIRPAAEKENPDPEKYDVDPLCLLGLAAKRGGRFATFDRGIDPTLIPGGRAACHVLCP